MIYPAKNYIFVTHPALSHIKMMKVCMGES